MSELDLLRKENVRLKQDLDFYKKKEKEMIDTILILKAKIIDIKNHQALGIDEEVFEAYVKKLRDGKIK